jgi:hypothetical protein
VAAVLAAFAFSGAASVGAQERTIDRTFPGGGRIVLDLSAGDYEIVGTRENLIHVEWRTGDAEDRGEVRVRADAGAGRATIVTEGPGLAAAAHTGFIVRIRVPRRSDLVVRLSAGDLDIRGIEGSKDVNAQAGDVNIEIGDRNDYRSVDASVAVGGLDASAFRIEKGGFFRSLHWNGRGKYELRANLKVGQVTLRE